MWNRVKQTIEISHLGFCRGEDLLAISADNDVRTEERDQVTEAPQRTLYELFVRVPNSKKNLR